MKINFYRTSKFITITKLILLVLITVLFQNIGFGQTSTPTPEPTPSARELELQEEIRVLKLVEQKETLEKNIRTAQPVPTTTPLQGSVTGADKMFMEVEMQSYKAMSQVADRIACDVRTNVPAATTIVLFKPEDYASWRNYKLLAPALKKHIEGMKIEYGGWLKELDFTVGGIETKANKFTPNPSSTPGGTGAAAPAAFLSAFSTSVYGVSTAVRSLSDLLAFFRTDVELSSKEVTVDDTALRSSLANSLRRVNFNTSNKRCEKTDVFLSPSNPSAPNSSVTADLNVSPLIKVYDPSMFSFTNSTSGSFSSDIVNSIEELTPLKRASEIIIADYETVVADSVQLSKLEENLGKKQATQLEKTQIVTNITLEKAKAQAEKKADFDPAIAAARIAKDLADKEVANENSKLTEFNKEFDKVKYKLEPSYRLRISRLKQLNTEFAQFIADFTKSSGNGVSPLTQFVRAENMDNVLKQNTDNNFWLQIKSVKSGGNNRIRKNIFRYFYGPDISYSGGNIAEFVLSDINGTVVLANTEAVYQKYQKASNIVPNK